MEKTQIANLKHNMFLILNKVRFKGLEGTPPPKCPLSALPMEGRECVCGGVGRGGGGNKGLIVRITELRYLY